MPEAQTTQALRPCAYHVVRYTPNLVRDEWVNIGILLFDPASGRLLQRLLEEPAEFARVRRLHPAADEEFLRRLSDDFATQSESVRGPLRSSEARVFGRAWSAACAWMNSPMRAIPCAWIMGTGATARGVSCKPYRSPRISVRPRYWPLRQMLSGKSSRIPNSLRSPRRSPIRRKIRAIALFLACSRRVKSAWCPWAGWRNGPIDCGLHCSEEAPTKPLRIVSQLPR